MREGNRAIRSLVDFGADPSLIRRSNESPVHEKPVSALMVDEGVVTITGVNVVVVIADAAQHRVIARAPGQLVVAGVADE